MSALSISRLADDVDRLRALRDVKDLHRRYAHLGLLGRWDEAADLFADDAELRSGEQTTVGRVDIADHLRTQVGADPGAFRAEFIDEPLAHLSQDARTARIRWSTICFSADGHGGTGIAGGLYENVYRRTPEGWRIAVQESFRQFEGDHPTGWTNVDGADLPIVPYHCSVDEVGIPLPLPDTPPHTTASVAELARRIDELCAEDAVRNLVHTYGYYVDRRMWTDVVDLFTEDARVELSPGGTFHAAEGVRAAMLTMGPEGLEEGQLNDRPLFDTLVRVLPGGRATTRSIELGMLGDAGRGEAAWEIRVVTTVCVRIDGLWRIRDLHVARAMKADYFAGWGNAELPALPVPTDQDPLGPDGDAAVPAADAVELSADPLVLRARLDRALAYDGAENVSAAYGYYIDDFRWPEMGALFAEKGNKQSPFAGYYLGRDRIMGATTATWGDPPLTRPGISYHWRTQPVISVSADGRSAHVRVRLFQPRTHKHPSKAGDFYAAGFHGGMYPNDQVVLEDGSWRLWSLTIDEPYFVSPDWSGGWSSVPPADEQPTPRPSPLLTVYPPDIPMTALGRREEHFRGGTGTLIQWPGILPMWFHYRNPVSGREPENFWPDCVPSEILPESRMTHHGYQMPPNGPEIDGVEV